MSIGFEVVGLGVEFQSLSVGNHLSENGVKDVCIVPIGNGFRIGGVAGDVV